MKSTKLIITFAAAAVAAAPAVRGEELDTEIAIERQVIPQHRAASRLSMTPEINLPAVTQMRIKAAGAASAVAIPASAAILDPAPYGTSADNPWRGYAAIGYFPAFNLGASAGYRIVDTRNTTVNAWLQYDGASWQGHVPGTGGDVGIDMNLRLRRHDATVGADVVQRVGSKSAFKAAAAYTFSEWNMPLPQRTIVDPYTGLPAGVTLNRLGVDLSWTSRPSDAYAYSVELGYGLMAYGTDTITGKNPNENSFSLAFTNDITISDNILFGIDLTGEAHNYNYPDQDLVKGKGGLYPHVRWSQKNFAVTAGLKIDILFDGGTHDFNGHVEGFVRPDIHVAWTPSGSFTLWGRMTGRSTTNPYGELFDRCRYIMPDYSAGYSLVDLDTEIGMTIGPWRGATLELHGGHASTSDWLMPYMGGYHYWDGSYYFYNMSGMYYGATASYKYRSLLELRAQADFAPTSADDPDKGYYLWSDRAHTVADLELGVHPIDKLTVSVGQNWRTGRRCYSGMKVISLGTASSLRVSASWKLTDALTIFARGENLLDKRHFIVPGIESQGVAGLIGVAYKIR